MPYNPLAIPYQVHNNELPANQAAAAAYKALAAAWNNEKGNVGTTWSQSPYFLPNWGDESAAPGSAAAQAISPVATAAVTRPDAVINARTIAMSASLNQEVVRLNNIATANTNALNAITALAPVPTVSKITPSTTLHGVAAAVTITGSGFSASAPTVNIGGACTSVVVQSDTQLTCLTPAASVAGTANVTVTTTKGTGTLTGGMIYT